LNVIRKLDGRISRTCFSLLVFDAAGPIVLRPTPTG
jgi:hypothetical protein